MPSEKKPRAKRTDQVRKGRRALDLIEEGTHLLRRAPTQAWTAYAAGTLPFALAFITFWADMSRDPYAENHASVAALGLAVLYVWMKAWQVIFVTRLRETLTGEPAPRWTPRRLAAMVRRQAFWQPTKLFVLPLAALATLPFPAAYAFYQNLTVEEHPGDDEEEGVVKRARQLAVLWPMQASAIVGIVSVFGLFVFINWNHALALAPNLLKMLFGWENAFTRLGERLALNSTFQAVTLVFTYLSLDALMKAIFLLRCFYGESLKNGRDLRVELREMAQTAGRGTAVALVLLATLVVFPASGLAQDTPGEPLPAPTSNVSPEELDAAIDDTLAQREYTWRIPRPDKPGDIESPDMFASLSEWIRETLEKWFNRPRSSSERSQQGGGWSGADVAGFMKILLYIALAGVIGVLGYFLFKHLRLSREEPVSATGDTGSKRAPDITAEDVTADALPVSGWLEMARELLAEGKYRLALRAFFLAQIASVADKGLITVARFKSNRDYLKELARRAHTHPVLLGAFSANALQFEGVWYGAHPVGPAEIDSFIDNMNREDTAPPPARAPQPAEPVTAPADAPETTPPPAPVGEQPTDARPPEPPRSESSETPEPQQDSPRPPETQQP